MNHPDTPPTGSPAAHGAPSFIRRLGTAVLLFALGIAIGYLPMWNSRRALIQDLGSATASTEARSDSLKVVRLHVLVSAAMIELERGHFEAARSLMSSFYEGVDQHWQGASPSALPAAVTEIRRARDETIALLSRNAPEALRNVSTAHASFLGVADPHADISMALQATGSIPDSSTGADEPGR